MNFLKICRLAPVFWRAVGGLDEPQATIMKLKTHLLFLVFGALCIFSFAGCQSAHEPGGTSHAAVTIKNRSDQEIRQVVKAVMAEDGYSFVTEGESFMGFQRPGSRRDAVKWGGWVDGQGVVIRAKLTMTRLSEESRLLQLDMFAVRDAEDSFFEQESRMMMLNKAPYRELLREVEKRLAPGSK